MDPETVARLRAHLDDGNACLRNHHETLSVALDALAAAERRAESAEKLLGIHAALQENIALRARAEAAERARDEGRIKYERLRAAVEQEPL